MHARSITIIAIYFIALASTFATNGAALSQTTNQIKNITNRYAARVNGLLQDNAEITILSKLSGIDNCFGNEALFAYEIALIDDKNYTEQLFCFDGSMVKSTQILKKYIYRFENYLCHGDSIKEARSGNNCVYFESESGRLYWKEGQGTKLALVMSILKGGAFNEIKLDAEFDVMMAKEDRELAQIALKSAGFYDGAIDSLFGAGTRGAIAEYQEQVGHVPTGFVGKTTYEKMVASLRTPDAGESVSAAAPIDDPTNQVDVDAREREISALEDQLRQLQEKQARLASEIAAIEATPTVADETAHESVMQLDRALSNMSGDLSNGAVLIFTNDPAGVLCLAKEHDPEKIKYIFQNGGTTLKGFKPKNVYNKYTYNLIKENFGSNYCAAFFGEAGRVKDLMNYLKGTKFRGEVSFAYLDKTIFESLELTYIEDEKPARMEAERIAHERTEREREERERVEREREAEIEAERITPMERASSDDVFEGRPASEPWHNVAFCAGFAEEYYMINGQEDLSKSLATTYDFLRRYFKEVDSLRDMKVNEYDHTFGDFDSVFQKGRLNMFYSLVGREVIRINRMIKDCTKVMEHALNYLSK